MMNWFYRWLGKKCQQALVNDAQEKESNQIGGGLRKIGRTTVRIDEPIRSDSVRFDTRPMTFNVYQANGGWAVEYNYYDRAKDESTTRLHIVPCEKDLGECLGKIVNYEILMK